MLTVERAETVHIYSSGLRFLFETFFRDSLCTYMLSKCKITMHRIIRNTHVCMFHVLVWKIFKLASHPTFFFVNYKKCIKSNFIKIMLNALSEVLENFSLLNQCHIPKIKKLVQQLLRISNINSFLIPVQWIFPFVSALATFALPNIIGSCSGSSCSSW